MPNNPIQPPPDFARLRQTPGAMASWQNAQQHVRQRQYAAALAIYEDLARRFPGLPALWAELGMAAEGTLDFARAGEATRRAVELAPPVQGMLDALGKQSFRMRDMEQAQACFERAVAADPNSIDARLTLAAWLERNRKLKEADECIEACAAKFPRDGRVLYTKAFLLHRMGRNNEAETALRDLLRNESILPLEYQCSANHLLGVILDKFEKYDESLSFVKKSKALRRMTGNAAALEQTYDEMSRRRRELLAQLTPDMLRRWREEAAAAPTPHRLALLAGVPRSGTTLIEQILGAHPDVFVVDEAPSYAREVLDPLQPVAPAPAVPLASIDGLAPARRLELAQRYCKSLLREEESAVGGRVVLDKNPFTTLSLHVWLRVFADSKVMIALRDPRDIITSCYYQDSPMTWGIVSFLSLEKTARFYADFMDVWLRLRDLGGFDWIETRYEDVVANLESEGRRITNFLGLTWDPKQTAYYESARGKLLNAPTYDDVTKPVYKRAVGRWRHYEEALEPCQEILAKYCRTFGYE